MALIIVQNTTCLVEMAATLSVVMSWHLLMVGRYTLQKMTAIYPGLAGFIMWGAGSVFSLSLPVTAGIIFAGAGVFSAILWFYREFFKNTSYLMPSTPSSEENSREGVVSQLIRKKQDEFYEVSIYDLAAYIEKSNAHAGETTRVIHQDTAEVEKTTGASAQFHQSFSSEPVKRIFQEYVQPWFREKDIMKPAICLLEILDRNADTPSVVIMDHNCMAQGEPCNIQYQALHKISLAEHTLNVVQEGLKLVREKFGETGPHTVWPRIALSIIGHDLGKISGIRAGQGYASLDHPALSADIVKECCGSNPEIAQECAALVLHHHGDAPRDFAFNSGLEILKAADARARRQELHKVLSHLRAWEDIPLEAVASELVSVILKIIKSGDMARDLFFVNQKAGIMYLNPDVLLGVLQTISGEKYLWPEIFSPDSQMSEKAMRQFMVKKMKPAEWLTENFSQERFAWHKIQKMGKVTGPRPFVEIVFLKFIETAGIKPSIILEPLRKSCVGRCRVLMEG